MNTNRVTNLKLQRQVMQKKIEEIGKANLTPALKAKIDDYDNIYRKLSAQFQKQVAGEKAVDKFLGDPNHINITSSNADIGTIENLSQMVQYGDSILKELQKK